MKVREKTHMLIEAWTIGNTDAGLPGGPEGTLNSPVSMGSEKFSSFGW